VLQQVSGISFRAVLIVSFVIALGLLFFGRGNNPIFNGMRGLVDGATAGFYSFVGPPIATGRQFVGNALRVFEVYRENDRLRTENAKLRAWQAQALTLQQKVARYEALLELPLEPDIQYRTGRVVDDPGGPFVRTFRINLGVAEGVLEGQSVISATGLVGRIVAAGKHASRVLLITDLNSRVPVMIEPQGIRGMLTGQNDGAPTITYLARDAHITPGSAVVTSGSGGIFPPNIPVGTVGSVNGDVVAIKPATLFDRVMYVRVLDYASPVSDVPYTTKGPPVLNGHAPEPTASVPPAPIATVEPAPGKPLEKAAAKPAPVKPAAGAATGVAGTTPHYAPPTAKAAPPTESASAPTPVASTPPKRTEPANAAAGATDPDEEPDVGSGGLN
jgi:rod shape-determining protein MreC